MNEIEWGAALKQQNEKMMACAVIFLQQLVLLQIPQLATNALIWSNCIVLSVLKWSLIIGDVRIVPLLHEGLLKSIIFFLLTRLVEFQGKI